jgi:hypothetical protein
LDGDEDDGIIRWTKQDGPVIELLGASSIIEPTVTVILGKDNV